MSCGCAAHAAGVLIRPSGSTIARMSKAAESLEVRPAEGSIIDTRYWHALSDGRVQCDVCPRACKLRDGQRGLCFVRGAEAGRIKLFSYGRSSGFCVDPIEKKPLHHFLPGTSVLSFGTAGCNLACKFCQNWGTSKSREMDTLADSASPEDLAAAAARLGCASMAFTYNDPVVFMEYAIDAARACRARGIKSVAVTAGHPDWKLLDKPRTPPATLTRARRIALANGLHYVYTGNVHDSDGGSTYCPDCGTRVIERDWYELGAWGLTDTGACESCRTQIPGVFAGPPGVWGARRLGVRLTAHATAAR